MKLIKKITGRLYLALPITHRADELRLSLKRLYVFVTPYHFFKKHGVIFNILPIPYQFFSPLLSHLP